MTIKSLFEKIAEKANRSFEGLKIMGEWTAHYDGKIVQFETGEDKFYLAVSKDRMEVISGEYSSADVTLRGPPEILGEVFTGRRRIGEVVKNWEIVMVGSGHECSILTRLVATVMLET